MPGQQLVLIVDDDDHIREVVRFALEAAGFRTELAGDGDEAVRLFKRRPPDLVILDIVMPGTDGIEVCKQLRRASSVPVVFLTSRDDEVDRIVGLELGGDDYVTKPFSPRELVARVRAVLRRAAPGLKDQGEHSGARPERVLRHGLLCLDTDTLKVFWGDSEVILTATELGILKTLLGFPGKVFSRDELMDGAYESANIVTDRTMDSHIRRVRKKFAEVGGYPIETVHGLGYRLSPCKGSETE